MTPAAKKRRARRELRLAQEAALRLSPREQTPRGQGTSESRYRRKEVRRWESSVYREPGEITYEVDEAWLERRRGGAGGGISKGSPFSGGQTPFVNPPGGYSIGSVSRAAHGSPGPTPARLNMTPPLHPHCRSVVQPPTKVKTFDEYKAIFGGPISGVRGVAFDLLIVDDLAEGEALGGMEDPGGLLSPSPDYGAPTWAGAPDDMTERADALPYAAPRDRPTRGFVARLRRRT